jgi:hypothetical protein
MVSSSEGDGVGGRRPIPTLNVTQNQIKRFYDSGEISIFFGHPPPAGSSPVLVNDGRNTALTCHCPCIIFKSWTGRESTESYNDDEPTALGKIIRQP